MTNRPLTPTANAQRRVRLRIFAVVMLAFLGIGLFGMTTVRSNARDGLVRNHELVLADMELRLTSQLREISEDLSILASENPLRQFALGVINPNVSAQSNRDDVILAFLSLIDQNAANFLAVRYVASDGQVRLEAVDSGLSGGTILDLSTPITLLSDPSFNAGMRASAGNVVLGSLLFQTDELGALIEPLQPIMRFSTPVRYLDTLGTVLGVIQVDLDATEILNIINEAPLSGAARGAGRRVILLNSQDQFIADSATTSLEDIYYVITEPGAADETVTARGLRSARSDDDIANLLLTDTQDLPVVDQGKFLVSTLSINTDQGLDMPWRLILVDDTTLALSESNSRSAFILVAALGVGALVAVLVTTLLRNTLRPFDHATTLAQQLAEGSPEVKSAPVDQNDLAQSITQIAKRLEKMNADMERQRNRLTRNLEIAARISRETAMLNDLDTLLNRVINLICEEYGFYHAQVFVVDDIGLNAVLVYSRGEVGQRLLAQNHKLPVGSDSVIGRVTELGRPVIVNDVAKSPKHHAFNPILQETRAEMAVPLFTGDAVVGVLDIQSNTPDVFRDEDLQAFQLLGDQIAIAINNGRLLMQSEERVRQIDSLNRQLTRTAWVDAEKKVALERVYNYNLRSVEEGTAPEGEEPVESISLPIRIRGEVVGSLDVAMPDTGTFSEGDQAILRAVTDRVALAIENARLFQETQITLNETSILYDLSRAINEADDLEGILSAIITTVMPEAVGGQVFEFDDYPSSGFPQWVTITADWAAKPREWQQSTLLGLRLHIPDYRFLSSLQANQITLVADVERDGRIDDELKIILQSLGGSSLLVIPLNMRGLWRGMMVIEFPEARRFKEQEGRIYTALIDQAGVAVDNRLLLRQTEATLELRERMYGASRGINTAQAVADLVRAVMTTSDNIRLNFAMSLLEGELNEYSWPKRERMVARSDRGEVFDVNEMYELYVPFESPMHAREPEIIIDNNPEAEVTPTLERMRAVGWRYAAIFPLFSVNQPVALFYVTSPDNHEMSSEDYEVYKALTGQMSTVLQNRRLLEQTAQALDESRRLYATSRAITGAQDSAMVYQAAAENIAALSNATSHVMVLLVGPNPVLYAPYLDFAYVWSRSPQSQLSDLAGHRVVAEEAPYAKLADEAGGLVHLVNLAQERSIEAETLNALRHDNAATLLIAPLQSRQNAFGVLVCQSDQPGAFDEQFVRFAQAVADQVAIAVENRQLFEEAQSEAQRALALAEVGQLATRIGTEFRRNISEVFATVADAAGYDRWLLVLSEDGSERLEQVTRRMPGFNESSEGGWFDLNTAKHSLVDAARENRLIMVNNPSQYAAFSNMNDEALEFIGKHIAAPVRVGTQTLGALLIGRGLEDADLTDRDEQLVSTLAAQVSVAVENRRLFLAAESERKALSSILETMPSGVLVLDAQTLLPIQSNAQIETLLGRPLMHDMPFDATYYNLYRTGTQLHYNNADLPIYQAAANGNLGFADDIVVIQPDGSQVDLLMNAAPIRDARGNISSIVAAMENISSLRGLENALQDNLRETIALYEATRALSEADEVENVLETLIAQLAMVEAGEAAIVLLDEKTEQLSVSRTLFTPAEEFVIPASVLKHRQALFIPDINYQPNLDDETREVMQSLGILALVSIPLRARSRDLPIGWVVTTYAETHPFSAEEERFLTTLSDSAASALDNRYLFLSTQNALQEASTLYQASRALTDATNSEDILNAVIDYLVHPQIAEVFIVQLNGNGWDDSGASADVVASWRANDDVLDMQGLVLSPEHFLAWRMLATRQLLMIEDVEARTDLEDLERAAIESMGMRSLVILPLRVGNRPLGAIWMASNETYSYTERDMRIFQSFAEQTSISLEAARLLNQTDRRARQLATSAEVSQAASSILDLDDLLPRLVDLIRAAFAYDHVQIFLMDREDDYAVLRASTGEAGQQMIAANHKLQRGTRSVIGTVVSENRPVIALDTGQSDVVHRPNPYLPLTRSEIGLPLVVKDKVVGALDVQSNQPNAFGQDDIAVLTTLAAQISVAIDNARLFEQSERRANDMSLLFAVTTAAASAETMSGALQNVAEDLRDSLDALSVGIYLPTHYVDELTDEHYSIMHVAAVAGCDQPLTELAEARVGDPRNMIGMIAANTRSVIINKIEDEPSYLPLVEDARSAVAVPLTSAGELVGLITMENAEAYAYSHETLTLLQTMGGTLSAIIENAQLLEQVQKKNDQLQELDRIKSEFLANMSHELRTPLNSIIGFSRVILKGIDGPLTEMQEQDLTTIYNSGQHLLGLINDILDQAKIASGKMDLKLDYFDVKSVVEGVRSIGIGLVKEKPININADIQSGLPQVYGDEFRTRQVLINLISNASKFTTEGSITISVYTVEDAKRGQRMVRIDVADSGIGIADKDMPLLFEPFRQVDSSLTRTAGGTGLGLPISRSLVEMQGGEMYVRSQVNVGSTFSITIPTEPTQEKKKTGPLDGEIVDEIENGDHSAENGSANGSSKDDTMRLSKNLTKDIPTEPKISTGTMPMVLTPKRQVLLIEDNQDRVDQFRRTIQREGFDVFTATIPLEAEAMASGLRPMMIILDVNFAKGAGWNILTKLKDRDDTFDIPVIVVTLSDEKERAMELGAHTFLQHPIMPEQLVAAVAEAEKDSITERILIIDDQPESTRLLTQLLDEHGQYRVFSAPNGVEGVSMVARRRPDLVLLDLRMPEMDGFAVLQELRSNPETANIPVLIVTGDTLDAAERDRLADVAVLYKTDISYEDFRQFIQGVRTHLSRNGEE